MPEPTYRIRRDDADESDTDDLLKTWTAPLTRAEVRAIILADVGQQLDGYLDALEDRPPVAADDWYMISLPDFEVKAGTYREPTPLLAGWDASAVPASSWRRNDHMSYTTARKLAALVVMAALAFFAVDNVFDGAVPSAAMDTVCIYIVGQWGKEA